MCSQLQMPILCLYFSSCHRHSFCIENLLSDISSFFGKHIKLFNMLEHLIYVNTWYPKYEVELAEQTHYTAFASQKPQPVAQQQPQKVEQPKKQEQVRVI